jgi:hypothetical protein
MGKLSAQNTRVNQTVTVGKVAPETIGQMDDVGIPGSR